MNINFCTLANDSVASFRYHAQMPARMLEQYGHSTVITEFPAIEADTVIFSKHWHYGDYWYLLGAKAKGIRTVMHVCDDHFNTKHRDHYIRMIQAADIVMASTDIIAERIKEATGRAGVKVVYDSIEGRRLEPKFAPNGDGKLKLFWQGHHSNLDGLMDNMPLGDEYTLRICTTPNIQLPREFAGMDARPWTLGNVAAAFAWCDAVIVPVRGEVQKLGKSHNRVTEAVQAGRFVVASEINSYLPYFETIYLGDLKKGLAKLKDMEPSEVLERISTAQDIAAEKYAPEVIGRMWEEALAGQ